jgi:hypothetical protein
MLKLRQVYEEIFNEIEGDSSEIKIVWPNEKHLCSPNFVSNTKK